MRLPLYLIRQPSGLFVFRIRRPSRDGTGWIKHSLRTHEPRHAIRVAGMLAEHYALAFAAGGANVPKTPEELLAGIVKTGRRQDWEVEIGPVKFRSDPNNPADQAAMLSAIKHLADEGVLPKAEQLVHAPTPAAPAPENARAACEPISLAALVNLWIEANEKQHGEEAIEPKLRAMREFRDFKGDTATVRDIRKSDIGKYVLMLRKRDLATSTLQNRMSYLRALFSYATANDYYPDEDPTKDQVEYIPGEKTKRLREHSFRAFTPQELRQIFDPEQFAMLGDRPVRWALLIGLYTGARVNEVGQLERRDINISASTITFTDDGEDQSVKNANSRRVVPLHPQLIALGLADYLAGLGNAKRAFPWATKSKNGPGNAITKSLVRYLVHLGVKVPKESDKAAKQAERLVGFHSLRKNVTHAFQGDDRVTLEKREAFLGHRETQDVSEPISEVHRETYMREWTPEELQGCIDALNWSFVTVEAFKPLLGEGVKRPRKPRGKNKPRMK